MNGEKVFILCLLFIMLIGPVTRFFKEEEFEKDYTLTVVYSYPYEKDSLYTYYRIYQSFDYGKTQIFFDILDKKNKFQIGQKIKFVE